MRTYSRRQWQWGDVHNMVAVLMRKPLVKSFRHPPSLLLVAWVVIFRNVFSPPMSITPQATVCKTVSYGWLESYWLTYWYMPRFCICKWGENVTFEHPMQTHRVQNTVLLNKPLSVRLSPHTVFVIHSLRRERKGRDAANRNPLICFSN